MGDSGRDRSRRVLAAASVFWFLTTAGTGQPHLEELGLAVTDLFADDFESAECAAWDASWNAPGAPDVDEDLFGDETQPTTYCQLPSGLVADASDCDDADELVHPGADEVCNGADDDCDAQADEGLADTNPVCSGIDLPDLEGDGNPDQVTRAGASEARYHLTILDVGDCFNDSVGAKFELTSPPGIDYDLHVVCFGCGASNPGKSSTVHDLDGHTDTVFLSAFDNCPTVGGGGDDSFEAMVEIRWVSGTACAQWNLTITGGEDSLQDETCGGDNRPEQSIP
jgi:hypothetical protein